MQTPEPSKPYSSCNATVNVKSARNDGETGENDMSLAENLYTDRPDWEDLHHSRANSTISQAHKAIYSAIL